MYPNIASLLATLESLTLYIQDKNPAQQFSLGCVYRPPSGTLGDDQLLFDQIKSLCNLYANLLIFDDFNFPKIPWPGIQLQDNDK